MARRQTIDPENPDYHIIQEVATRINRGQVVVIPTDTAYGLTGNPSDATVVQRILRVKQRTTKAGMPLLAANLTQVKQLVTLSPLAEAVANQFWPGAVTIIVPTRHLFPLGVVGPNQSLAIRIPNHAVALALIRLTGYPIIGTSANKSRTPSPRSAEMVATQLGDQVDYILDAGPTQHLADSTIVTFTRDPPEIIREGAIPRSDIEFWLKGGH
jgi:L-threonylcarbamoyladenylate synthase